MQLIYFGLLHRLPESTTLQALTVKILAGLNPLKLIQSVMLSSEFKQLIPADCNKDYRALLPQDKPRAKADAFRFVGTGQNIKINNVVYLSPAISWPIGGLKVLIRNSEIINKHLNENISSEVYFPEAPEFNVTWFEHKASIKRDNIINIDHDFVVVPEVMALKYGKMLKQSKVKYAIFVQNGYYIFDELIKDENYDLTLLREIYLDSTFVLSISEDSGKCVQEAFPIPDENLLKINPSIDEKIFFYEENEKKNIITYMPRKLTSHANYIINHLKVKKNKAWTIIPIENLSESEVAQLLRKSKIFLSFSDREGLSLPPLEAALCGNIVIGYTGQGGKEYWKNILFKEIESGNLIEFVRIVEQEMIDYLEINKNITQSAKRAAIEEIKERYSEKKEINQLMSFISKLK